MIHDGTISSGCAWTEGVAGSYWISSMSRLRKTTLPGVSATALPGRNCSTPRGLALPSTATASRDQFAKPVTRLAAPAASVRFWTCGLVAMKLEGDHMSSHWRKVKPTSSSWCLDTPRTLRAASLHHCSCNRNACDKALYGGNSQSFGENRLSCGAGSTQRWQSPCQECAEYCSHIKVLRNALPTRSACFDGDTRRWVSQSE